MPEKVNPTERELEILKVLWDRGEATVRDVYEELRQRLPIVQNTVQAFLRTMEDKGLVTHRLEGRTFIYQPTYQRQQTTQRMAEQLLTRAFDGAMDQLVQSVLSLRQPTKDELQRLEELLAEAKANKGKASRKEGVRTMNELLMLLAQNALLLVMGATLLLTLGCGAVMLCKSPVHRQRISELTIVGVLGWMVLALFPLPRLLPSNIYGDNSAAKPQASVPANPVVVEPENVEPEQTSSEILPPVTEIPIYEPALVPEAMESVPDQAPVENVVTIDGTGVPSYAASPSEELPSSDTAEPSPTTVEENSASTPSPWQFDLQKLAGLFTGAYLAGASLCVLWILAGYAVLLRIRLTAAASPEWLTKHFRSLAKKSGIAPPQLIVSHSCNRPLTWGVLWPVVVLPQPLCRQENKSQLDTILLHELGHIAQQDAQGNLLFCAALPLLFAHPLYWWLRRESQLAAELVADDWAAWQTGKETYVEELVALARCTSTSSLPLVGVTGLFSSPSQFYRRMSMLLAREKPLSTRTSLPWRLASLSALAGAVALAASLAGVRPAAGQTEPIAPPAVTPAPAASPPATPPVAVEVPMALPPSSAAPGATTPVPAPPLTPPSLTPRGPTSPALPDSSPPPALTPQPAKTPITFTSEDEEAALLREIAQLQDKLRSLEAKRGNTNPAGMPGNILQRGDNHVLISRKDKQGVAWLEFWTTDEQGRPTKIMSKAPAANTGPVTSQINADGKTITMEFTSPTGSRVTQILDRTTGMPIAENRSGGNPNGFHPTARRESEMSRTTTVNDGKTITTVFMNPDGSRVERILDSATGKTIAENRIGYPKGNQPQVGDRTVERRFPTPIVSEVPVETTARTPVPSTTPQYYVPQPAGDPNQTKGTQQLDLVTLATSYADAVSALEAAAAKLADNERLGDAKAISQQEVTLAKLALSAAKRKEQLLRSIAEAATQSAARDVERAAALHKGGYANSSATAEAETRLIILKQILGSRPAENNPSPNKP